MLPHDRKREDKIGAMISLLSVTLCNIAGLAAIMYFATLTIGADQRYKTDQIMWILVTIGSIILCNTVLVTTTYESGQRFILVAIFIVLVPLFFNFPFGRTIPKSTMRWFKFGSIEHALLILDEVGCNISRSHGIPVEQRVPDPKTCVLPDVMILSRLGTPYYIQMGETPQKRLTIPSQNVLSWSVIESKKATPPESPQNP
jgi:hypothetical protein